MRGFIIIEYVYQAICRWNQNPILAVFKEPESYDPLKNAFADIIKDRAITEN